MIILIDTVLVSCGVHWDSVRISCRILYAPVGMGIEMPFPRQPWDAGKQAIPFNRSSKIKESDHQDFLRI